MKERPILFSGAMVRALLAGTKTQTRRVVKPQPRRVDGGVPFGDAPAWAHAEPGSAMMRCPYGKPGDWLWVREAWQHSNHPYGPYDEDCMVFYRADFLDDVHGPDGEKSPEGHYRTWRPSIHMPRTASRIVLEIKSVRVERLHDISEADAIAEGIERADDFFDCRCWRAYDEPKGSDVVFPDDPIGSYASLWMSINGPGSWDANPWVWVLEFRRLNVEHSPC
ncbi:hypothetical protein [Simplicispira sedimenti]|uniref:hypothetical protein n=1 Tax=Simplicispira sedimenti TaxID=2919500 RepID=UPI001FAB2D75|nr:hypothetical protein [Acidovorax sp. W1-6]